MADETQRWPEVARQLNERMVELRISKATLIERSGISFKTITRYLDGDPIRSLEKRAQVARAVWWTDNSIDRILRGEDPQPLAVEEYEEVRRPAATPASFYELALVEQQLRREIDRVDRDVEAVAMALDLVVDYLRELPDAVKADLVEIAMHPHGAAAQALALRGYERRRAALAAKAERDADVVELRPKPESPVPAKKAAKSGRAAGRKGEDRHRPKGTPEEPPSP